MKNNRYFRHDWGARNDPKIRHLVTVKGAAAKAVYWDFIEMLYEEGGNLPIYTIEDVALLNRVDIESVKYVVFDSGLFCYNETHFWSVRQQRDEMKIKEICKARSESGRAGGIASGNQRRSKNEPNANQNGSKSEAINKNKINKDIDILSTKVSNISCPTPTESDAENPDLFPENKLQEEKIEPRLSDKHCKQIADYWNKLVTETGANYSKVLSASLSEKRKNKIRIRWKEFSEVGNPVEVCREVFKRACASKFLQGERGTFHAQFDWFFEKQDNWVKTYEGTYDNHDGQVQQGSGGFVGRLANQLRELEQQYNNDNDSATNGNYTEQFNASPDEQ